jgi:hypothetical protein
MDTTELHLTSFGSVALRIRRALLIFITETVCLRWEGDTIHPFSG